MKNGEVDQEFLESLKAHDPVDDNGLRDWAGSDAGRRVLSRIGARRDGGSRRMVHRSRRFRALALSAGVLAAVAIAVGVIIGVGGGTGTAPEIAVDRVAALEGVLNMVEARQGGASVERPPSAPEPRMIAALAESLGIITGAEREVAATPGPVSRGVYALWVWRGLGSLLTPVREATLNDLDGLSDEMRAAVIGVFAAGILDARAAGAFAADEALTPEEELEALARLETALGLGPAGSSDSLSQ